MFAFLSGAWRDGAVATRDYGGGESRNSRIERELIAVSYTVEATLLTCSQQVLLHEFGHTAGLGHAPSGDVMGVKYNPRSPIQGLTDYDKAGMEEVIEAHTH